MVDEAVIDFTLDRMRSIDLDLLNSAAACDLAGVRAALDAGASPHAFASDGQTALHFAVSRRRPDIALDLLRAGARVDIEDAQQRTPMSITLAQEFLRHA